LPANYLRLAVKTDAENDLLMAALDKENFDAR
jgi:histidinol-phosphate/aromatic aminotransferase/cobyric acid decarboxylase-like protein